MEMQYWNGHNLEYPPSAWNYGTNTAESVQNVVPRSIRDNGSGYLGASETNGSSGSLGLLYDRDQVAQVTFDMGALGQGTLELGRQNYSYVGDQARLTMPPGHYPVQLWNGSTPVGGSGWLNVTGGESTVVTVPILPPRYNLSFAIDGLPFGTEVGLSVNGVHRWASDGWVNLTLPPGMVPYTIDPVAGYWLSGGYAGTADLTDGAATVLLDFRPFTYAVEINETGLAPGSAWTVNISGGPLARAIAPASVTVPLANGSWFYNVTSARWYAANPGAGSLSVAGSGEQLEIQFGPALSDLVGTVAPATA